MAVAKPQATLMSMPGKADARPAFNPRPLKLLARFREGTLELGQGTWCALRIGRDGIGETMGDCADVKWAD